MFGGPKKPGAFLRSRVSATERALAWALLVLLAAIGAAVFLKGRQFDPGLFALDPVGLPAASPQQAPSLPPATLSSPAQPAGPLDNLAPEGWKPLGPVERFTPDNLYVKINGRADQYLAYDVVRVSCVSLAGEEDRFIDVFLYDMGLPLNAFGIYSVERAEGAPSVDLGREGYCSESSYFFWKGGVYVQVLASATDDGLTRAGETIARTLANRIPDSGEPVWATSALPERNRVPQSTQFFKRNALSLGFLTNTCTARYRKDGVETTAFVSSQASPKAAEQTFLAYTAYLQEYGEIAGQNEVNGVRVLTGDSGGYFDVVFRFQSLVGGVAMAEDRALAEETARALLAHLQGR